VARICRSHQSQFAFSKRRQGPGSIPGVGIPSFLPSLPLQNVVVLVVLLGAAHFLFSCWESSRIRRERHFFSAGLTIMTVPAANALIKWSPYFPGLVVVGRFNGSVILGAQLERKFHLNDDKVNRHLVQPRTAILPNYCSSFDYRYGCLNV
jgi:hypothetical protein